MNVYCVHTVQHCLKENMLIIGKKNITREFLMLVKKPIMTYLRPTSPTLSSLVLWMLH